MDYTALAEAIKFYVNNHGFLYVDLPWVVRDEVCDLTRPNGADPIRISHIEGEVVASGEQSFLQLFLDGRIKRGKRYVGCSPCFRDEKELSSLTRPYFMKVELFCPGSDDIDLTLRPAFEFFSQHIYFADLSNVIVGDSQVDIFYKKRIELGSYCVYEKSPVGKWVCGTGCAEPRFSRCVKG